MRALLVVLVLALGSGCPGGGGNCSAQGDFFPSARATATASDAGVVVDVRWQVNATVPDAFYAAARVSGDARLVDAGATGATLISNGPFRDGGVNFSLEYVEGPTRCSPHPGMDDTYVLEVFVPVPPGDGGTSVGTITTDLRLGAL